MKKKQGTNTRVTQTINTSTSITARVLIKVHIRFALSSLTHERLFPQQRIVECFSVLQVLDHRSVFFNSIRCVLPFNNLRHHVREFSSLVKVDQIFAVKFFAKIVFVAVFDVRQ